MDTTPTQLNAYDNKGVENCGYSDECAGLSIVVSIFTSWVPCKNGGSYHPIRFCHDTKMANNSVLCDPDSGSIIKMLIQKKLNQKYCRSVMVTCMPFVVPCFPSRKNKGSSTKIENRSVASHQLIHPPL